MADSEPVKLLIANDEIERVVEPWVGAIKSSGINVEVLVATNVVQASQIFAQHHPQLVISDLLIPTGTGRHDAGDAAAAFARDCEKRGAHVVVASDWDYKDVAKGLNRIELDCESVVAWVQNRHDEITNKSPSRPDSVQTAEIYEREQVARQKIKNYTKEYQAKVEGNDPHDDYWKGWKR